MARYEPKTIEPKWQKRWLESGIFKTPLTPGGKSKFYILDMFPYPSAAGLHVGHPEGYTATDIIARMKRMQGHVVLHPMGWDAFGLPAENYAIATGVHPAQTTAQSIAAFKRQIQSLGFSYDWEREIDTTNPNYYKWTQWIFLQLFKKGLAYEAHVPINFCPSCRTGLANEEVHQGGCERCGSAVIKKNMRQWMLRITAYAERLLQDLERLDWPESTLAMQRHWIGRSEGAEIEFRVARFELRVSVFTTRPDTLFGATYLALAPEHPLVDQITSPSKKTAVEAYCQEAQLKTDMERTQVAKEKTGVFTGAGAINPVNGETIPIWVADYILPHYGTGAIMAVPGHDQRDYEFAKKMNLPIKPVARPLEGEAIFERAFEEDGIAINSGEFDGLTTADFKKRMVEWLSKKGVGRPRVSYKLRDWVFSRQRYWGEPIPVVHCQGSCGGVVPVPESGLPVALPDVSRYQPTGTGDSPLSLIESWVKTKCPVCGSAAERETNTMPQWAGSCWYYLRFVDPYNDQAPWDQELQKIWLPVDLYVGGAEHAVLHLLYSRFWHKVLFDLGLVSTIEPFMKLRHQGMILAYSYQDKLGVYHGYDEIDVKDSKAALEATGEELSSRIEKMSKSKKNVVNPDEVIKQWGADTMRLYEMFMGEFELSKPWDMRSIEGVHRFLLRVWRLFDKQTPSLEFQVPSSKSPANTQRPAPSADANLRVRHRTIKLVTERIENFKFNTAITALMEYVNALTAKGAAREDLATLCILLSPLAPHTSEECWEMLGEAPFVSLAPWPVYDEELAVEEKLAIAVQINGRVRETLTLNAGSWTQDQIAAMARENPKIAKYLENAKIQRVVYVPGKIFNFVVANPAVVSE
ncbi:MAG: leucine--tRNA ligase [Elusimicrobia bacterium]|nr:leucine--tRNA ligase [Elusimicrobiota bacterium]